jgi:hypothetical protein
VPLFYLYKSGPIWGLIRSSSKINYLTTAGESTAPVTAVAVATVSQQTESATAVVSVVVATGVSSTGLVHAAIAKTVAAVQSTITFFMACFFLIFFVIYHLTLGFFKQSQLIVLYSQD